MAAGSSTASGSCMRVGQSACAGAGTAGWTVNTEQQLQAPPAVTSVLLGTDGGSSDPPPSLCLSTQSDNAQSWPFTSPIPTSHGKYDGSLHDTGVGNLLASCSAVTKQGNWVRTYSTRISHTRLHFKSKVLCAAARRRRCCRASTNRQRHFGWSVRAAIPSASRPHPWPAQVPSLAAQSQA